MLLLKGEHLGFFQHGLNAKNLSSGAVYKN